MPRTRTSTAAPTSLPDGADIRAKEVLARLSRKYPLLGSHLTAENPWQLLVATLSEARFAMALAAATAFGRIVSEIGIAMMVGGNIKWHTRTITTAIALETGKGEFATGIALGIVLMLVALVVNLLVGLLRGRSAGTAVGRRPA